MAPSVWTLPEVREWKIRAAENQKEIHEKLLGDREYDFFESTDHGKELLRRKILFAMCGPPTSEDLSRSQEDENKLIEIFDFVCKQNAGQKSFRVSFLFVACLTRKENVYSTVIRLILRDNTVVFVDNVPRSYNGFQDYLENNRLPKCLMCYPASGSYYLRNDETFDIDYRKSSACGELNKFLLVTDVALLTTTIASFASIGAASIFGAPFLIPTVAIGATAAYSAGRSVGRLYDMGTHGTSVGLRNPEARGCWLTLGGAALGGTALVSPISPWVQVGKVAQAPFVASVTVSGLGVVNGVTNIVQKKSNGKAIDAKDGAYLAAAIFFFGNAVVTTYQAQTLVDEMFAKGITPDSIYEYLESLVTQKLSVAAQERIDFGSLLDSNAMVNLVSLGNLSITPEGISEDFSVCFNSSCKLISENAQKYANKLLAIAECAQILYPVLDKLCAALKKEMMGLMVWYCKLKKQKSLSAIFGDITVQDALDIGYSLINLATWFRRHVPEVVEQCSAVVNHVHPGLEDAIELQNQAGTVRPEDGVPGWTEEFQRTCELLKKEFDRQKASYQERFETVKKFSPNLSENAFQEVEGITGTLNEFFWKKAVTQMQKDFSGDASLLKLSKGLLKASPGSSCLEDVDTGTKAYFFHGMTPAGSDQQLSREQHFSLVREKVGLVLDQDASLEVDEDSRLAFFRDLPNNAEGISCVIVKCVPEDGFVAGNIFVAKGDAD